MKSEDLRIGNFIGMNLKEFPENWFRVLEPATRSMKVTDDWNRYDMKGREVDFYDADLMEGIPLTPEWLERFGFEIQIGTPANSGARYIEFESSEQQFRVYVNTNKDDEKESSLHLAAGNGWFPCLVEFSYVHTFQNIFHSLTGQELTLKP